MRHQSLRKKIIVLWSYVFIAIMAVSAFYGGYIFKTSVEESKKAISDTHLYYIANISRDINDMIKATNSIYLNNYELRKMERFSLDDFEWMKTAYNLTTYLDMKVQAVSCPVGMFFFDKKRDALRSLYNPAIGSINKYDVDNCLRACINSQKELMNGMTYFSVNEKNYLCYYQENKGVSIGFVFDPAEYIESSDLLQTISIWNGKTIISESGERILAKPEKILGDEKISWNNLKYVITEGKVEGTPVGIAIIQNMVSYKMIWLKPVIICAVVLVPLILFIMLLYILYVLNNTLLYPVQLLANHMRELESGTGNESVNREKWESIDEYAQLNKTILGLLNKIEELREQKFQEERKANWARLQYYKLQINPHFYLNCLNTISLLIDRNNSVAANGMIRDLSSHFRYVFQDQKQFVTLGDEIDEIRALCNIYSLRAQIPILLDIKVEQKYMSIMIPPLTLQTFVENSIKHRDDSGNVLQITILHEQLQNATKIYVIDNGKGFSDIDLEKYNEAVGEYLYQSNHVGIDNFKFRMKLLYNDKASFRFYNNEQGGAVSEITIWERLDEHIDY